MMFDFPAVNFGRYFDFSGYHSYLTGGANSGGGTPKKEAMEEMDELYWSSHALEDEYWHSQTLSIEDEDGNQIVELIDLGTRNFDLSNMAHDSLNNGELSNPLFYKLFDLEFMRQLEGKFDVGPLRDIVGRLASTVTIRNLSDIWTARLAISESFEDKDKRNFHDLFDSAIAEFFLFARDAVAKLSPGLG